jgi:dTDP-4-dehydrorhamnose reductase
MVNNHNRINGNMRVLVLGAYGMLGHRLLLQLTKRHDVNGTCRRIKEAIPDSFLPRELLIEGVDANIFASVAGCVSKTDPDAVVNCIGIVKQSYLAGSPVPSIIINSLFPHQLAGLCAERGIRVLHFSTDCVFSGKKGNYGLDDLHDAVDLYGKTKSLGELDRTEGVTIRSSIIGRELDSSNGLLEWFASQRGKKVRGFTNAIFSGFTTNEMANVVESVLDKTGLGGVYQVASAPISKFDLLVLVKKILDLNVVVEPHSNFYCNRSLDGTRFEVEAGYAPPSWENMIGAIAKDWCVYDELRMGFNEGV